LLALLVVGEAASILAGGLVAVLTFTGSAHLSGWIGWLGLSAALGGTIWLARIVWLRRK
jgi:hypothetical protein